MGNCDSTTTQHQNIEPRRLKVKKTHYDSYKKSLKEEYRIYKTKKGTYMLWNNDGDDIRGYLIKGVFDDIEYHLGPKHFGSNSELFEVGDVMYHTLIRFKRCVSNPNIIKPVATSRYSHSIAWYPFMPKSARIARNRSIANAQKNQENRIRKIMAGDKIELRDDDCKLWYRK